MAAIGRGWASSSIERLDPAAMPAKGSLGREIIEAGAGSPQDLPGEVALGGEGPDCVS